MSWHWLCYNIWHFLYYSSLKLKDTQLCAGGVKDKDSCGGDSGGPLMFPGKMGNFGVRYVQRGIVSFGSKRCGLGGFPGVYTNVAYYMNWILDNIRSWCTMVDTKLNEYSKRYGLTPIMCFMGTLLHINTRKKWNSICKVLYWIRSVCIRVLFLVFIRENWFEFWKTFTK